MQHYLLFFVYLLHSYAYANNTFFKLGLSLFLADEDLSVAVTGFDEIINGPFKNFVSLSNQIGGDVATQVAMVSQAFNLERSFVALASKSKQPSDGDMAKLLAPTANKISEITEYRNKNRRSDFFNHLSAISESIAALGWVQVVRVHEILTSYSLYRLTNYVKIIFQKPAPSPFVKEMNDAGQFYANRVLKDFKEKDKKHVEWTKAWSATLAELQAYVKQHHTTGLVWNPKGGDAMSSAAPAGKQNI